jgi:hypothetical protein
LVFQQAPFSAGLEVVDEGIRSSLRDESFLGRQLGEHRLRFLGRGARLRIQ